MIVKIKRSATGADLPLPEYATEGSAGLDLRCASTSFTLRAGARALVDTGVSVAIPPGFEGQVRPRSGLAMRYGVTVANAPGTIDSDYTGPVGVILANHGEADFAVCRGERIAQLVICPVARAELVEVDSLDETGRGGGGFGSTGR